MIATEFDTLADKIQALEFDTVFRIVGDGVERVDHIYAPNVWHDPTGDVEIEPTQSGFDNWQCLTGMTGQYGYRGAAMHASELVGAGIAEALAEMTAETPHVFALVVVEVYPGTEDDGEDTSEYPEPAGWAIAYHAI